jgi:hypothetical protein
MHPESCILNLASATGIEHRVFSIEYQAPSNKETVRSGPHGFVIAGS